MAHLVQVGVGSGGMPVLDLLSRDPRIERITLIDPDIYKDDNIERHLFPKDAVGRLKVDLAESWLLQRRSDLHIQQLPHDLMAEDKQEEIETAVQSADIGVCAADNEAAKFHWDRLMRKHGKPWTLGEVLSGGIGGFVHWFIPGGPCYGCVASHLKRVDTDKPPAPDYSHPDGPVHEVRIPASMASIHAIASLHALVTLDLLKDGRSYDPGFSSLLWTLQEVPDVFDQAFKPFRFKVTRSSECFICHGQDSFEGASSEELDVALDQALARLGDE